MASEVDICNLALSHIGQDANVTAINPPDGTFEADKCATFYPVARDEFIERHAWRFALTRLALTQLSATPPGQWLYAYALPNNCLRPLSVMLAGETDDTNGQAFTIETLADGATQAIYTNAPAGCVLKYIILQRDTTKFTPNFVVALSWRLASYLAGPITKDMKLKKATWDASEAFLLNASALDAESEKNDAYRKDFTPGSIAARQ